MDEGAKQSDGEMEAAVQALVLSLPELKPLRLYRVTEAAALHQTHGTHLPLRAAAMVPQTPRPPQEEMREEEGKGGNVVLLGKAGVTKEAADGTKGGCHHLSCGEQLPNKFHCFIAAK